MTLAAGTRLGPYEILAPLGAGGMGEVYRARDTKLDRDVAIKVLPESVAANPDALARFEREAKAVAALSHQNILSIFDFGTQGGVSYAVTELLEGETLRSKLSAGPIPQKQAVDYALQIARGLPAAHEKGVVHRDLKPENLFVARDGHLKILDFGLAKKVQPVPTGQETSVPTESGHTEPGTVMGTVGYMSPEQVRGLPVDHRSDIFSFGAILYELFSGMRAFKRATAADTLSAILKEEPPELSGSGRNVPVPLENMIRRCLEKDRENRFQSARDIAFALAEASSLPATPAPRPRVKRPLVRVRTLLAAAAAVVLAALLGWLWHRSSRERWARDVTHEIARLVDASDYAKAVVLAKQARAVLPNDKTLGELWLEATRDVSFESKPAGAEVALRPYQANPDAWEVLGRTPLKTVRVPNSALLFRVTKPGFTPIVLLDGPPIEWSLTLQADRNAPPGTVAVPAGPAFLGWPFWVPGRPGVPVDDFFIDRHEVTNERYKKFVDAGGYQARKFWQQPFVDGDGRTVEWETAVALFRDTTGRPGPATWEAGTFPAGRENHPVSGVSWYEAAAYAEFVGASLPTIYHWSRAAQTYFVSLIVPGSNFRGSGTQPVGAARTLSGFGTTDMAGNVKEWCWNETRAGARFILGGGFGDPTYMFNQTDAQSPWDRRANYGFRCVRLAAPPSPATTARMDRVIRDFSKERPVSPEIFTAFKGLYAYDKAPLNARIEESRAADRWTHEKVSFDAAYGGERVTAHLFLPKNTAPPFQTVIYCPGASGILQSRFDPAWIEGDQDFILHSGRALMFPIYKGMLERRDNLSPGGPGGNPPASWRDHLIACTKDLSRSIDYLHTREIVDGNRLAYYGFSWGGSVGPVFLAIEDRFKAAILHSAGLWFQAALPEADVYNFTPRVKVPVLMLSDRYDNNFPVDSSQLTLFRSLGVPQTHKRRVIFDSGHGRAPRKDVIRESLDWLDKYLGPVKR